MALLAVIIATGLPGVSGPGSARDEFRGPSGERELPATPPAIRKDVGASRAEFFHDTATRGGASGPLASGERVASGRADGNESVKTSTTRRGTTRPAQAVGRVGAEVGFGRSGRFLSSVRAESGCRGGCIEGLNLAEWHARAVRNRRVINRQRETLRRRWRPTVHYAYKLAAAAYGVSESELRAIGGCESNHDTHARNGIYRGVMQEGPMFERGPFGRAGFSVWDPIANVLTAAWTRVQDGSWRQWTCRPR